MNTIYSHLTQKPVAPAVVRDILTNPVDWRLINKVVAHVNDYFADTLAVSPGLHIQQYSNWNEVLHYQFTFFDQEYITGATAEMIEEVFESVGWGTAAVRHKDVHPMKFPKPVEGFVLTLIQQP